MKQTEKKTEPIQAVERALMILETLSDKGNMNLGELHKDMKINKASLLRLAFTLVQCGYLNQNQETGDYSLTTRAYEVGMSAIRNLDKNALIHNTLIELHNKTGRIAQFSIEDNNQLLCVQSVGGNTQNYSIYTNVGRHSPLYCTSAGKAILSTYSNGDILEKWKSFQIQKLTEHTITDVQSLLRDINQTRQQQYARDMEESEYDLFCVGTVILGSGNTPVGAISLSGSTLSLDEERQLTASLLPKAARLSSLLGYVPGSGEVTF